jgi:hypothetical protein
VSAKKVAAILSKSGLPQAQLRTIWLAAKVNTSSYHLFLPVDFLPVQLSNAAKGTPTTFVLALIPRFIILRIAFDPATTTFS